MVKTLESRKIHTCLWCDHSVETSLAVLFHGTVYYLFSIILQSEMWTLKVNACSVQYYNLPWRWRGIVSPLRFAAPSRNPGAMYFPVLDAADGSAVPAAAPKNRTTANLDSKQTNQKWKVPHISFPSKFGIISQMITFWQAITRNT